MSAKSVCFTGHFTVHRPLIDAFPLFSPLGEKVWVPDWNPETLHPRGVDWAEGQIFRTEELYGDAVWIVAQLDGENHRVRYYRVEPEHLVARIDVSCRESATAATNVTVSYEFVSLSPRGNETIGAMSQEEHDLKMKSWEKRIREALAAAR